jgi:hypothetical protein
VPEQVAYQFVNFLFDGKMVSSKNAFALGSNEYQMVKNMRYVEDGVETRRGCSIHNATDVNDGSTTISSIMQMVVDRYSLTRTIIQADDLKYYYDDDLPTVGAFTGLTMYPTTEDASALRAISCGVGETEIFCNAEENWVYHGTQPRPTAIFHYDDSATSYISWIDEIYSLKTTDLMILDDMTGSDYIYLGFWVPFSGAYFDLTTFNTNAADMLGQYFNGAWTDLPTGGDNESNTTYKYENCSDISDWNNQDSGNAASTQATFDSREVFKILGGATGGGNTAKIDLDLGTFGDDVTTTIRLYHEDLGTQADVDHFALEIDTLEWRMVIRFGTDGLFVYDGGTWNEIGTNIVDVDTWTTWTFQMDFDAETANIWKDGVSVATGVDVSYIGDTDGMIDILQYSNTTANRLTYIDYIKVGDDILDGAGFSDGTESGTSTLGQDGLISWNLPTDWVPTMVEGGLWYFMRFKPDATLDAEVEVNNIYIQAPMQKLANLWDQSWQPVSGCYHFDETQSEYKDYLPKVIDGLTATYMFLEDFEGGADNDGIYIGTPYKPLAFRIKVDPEHTNVGNAEFDVIEGWDGGAWDAGTGLTDTTKGGSGDIASLSQNGLISFNNGSIAYRRGMLEGEEFPMYWTRLEIDADAVTAEVRIWDIAYIPDMDDPSGASSCMEFKDRLLLIGPKDYPNEVWISAPYNPQGFNGNEFTKMVFGDGRKLTDGVSFFNEALVFKEDSTWLIQGFRRVGAGAFGRLRLDSKVGAFRKTAQLGRIWITEAGAGADDYRNVVFFQHRTGVYFSDGNKPIYISDDVSSYFNENHADYVGAANIAGIDSWFDYSKDEYHLVFATGLELVYNAWFKKWSDFERDVDLKSGAAVIGSSGEPLTYGGSAIGKVFRLENDTSDKDSSDADAAIDAHVITKAHWPGELEHEINFRRLILVGEGNLTNGGVITINGAIDGGDITDNTDAQYFTLDDTLDTDDTYDHRGYVKGMFPFSIGDDDIEEALHTLQLKFGCSTIDLSIKLVGYGLGVAIQRMHFDE